MPHADPPPAPLDRYRLPPGRSPGLRELPEDDTGPYHPDDGGKALGKLRRDRLRQRLAELQRVFYADGRYAMLVVLQAMDTGGKDSTIRRVFRGVNPQGVDVTGFGVPTPAEAAHDFLWRVHAHTPGKGRIAVFNRSHYEDVLVVRVKELVPETVWRPRFDAINAFERTLAAAGTIIRKFYLHIDRDEQRERLQERLDDPTKHWKFNPADLKERARWDAYMDAYEEALTRTSTPHAPWTVVPARRKWYRDLVVLETLVEALESLDLRYPPAAFDPSEFQVS